MPSAILAYTPNQLLALRPQVKGQHSLPAATVECIRELGIRRRARGCRAGRNIQRPIQTTISSREGRGADITSKHQQTMLAARQSNLVEIPRQPAQHRHPPPPPHQMAFGTLNVRSLNTRADVIKQLMSETNIQVMCLTETGLARGR